MRRKDREVTDISIIDAFIAKEKIIRIAFADEGDIYIVPVNYGYKRDGEESVFYFHGAKAGRKYELAKSSPDIGFEIDGGFSIVSGREDACDYSAKFQSVIGTGKLSLIEDRDEKKYALDCFMKHQTGRSGWNFDEKELKTTAVFSIRVNKMTCKIK